MKHFQKLNTNYLTFENVSIHGTIEGDSNVGAFYQYGTANGGSAGGFNYTVDFKKCSCDASLISKTNATASVLAGHICQGSGHKATFKLDTDTYNGIKNAKMYLLSGDASYSRLFNGTYANSTTLSVTVNNENKTNLNEGLESTNVYKFIVTNPVKNETGTFKVNKGSLTSASNVTTKATKAKVYFKTQVTAWNNGSYVTNENGITATFNIFAEKTFGEEETLEVFNKIEHVKFARQDSTKGLVSEFSNGTLTLCYPFNSNYKYTGTIKLAVAQYKDDGTFVTAGDIEIAKIADKAENAVDPYNTEWTLA